MRSQSLITLLTLSTPVFLGTSAAPLPAPLNVDGIVPANLLGPLENVLSPVASPVLDALSPVEDALAPLESALTPLESIIAPVESVLAPVSGLLGPLAPVTGILGPVQSALESVVSAVGEAIPTEALASFANPSGILPSGLLPSGILPRDDEALTFTIFTYPLTPTTTAEAGGDGATSSLASTPSPESASATASTHSTMPLVPPVETPTSWPGSERAWAGYEGDTGIDKFNTITCHRRLPIVLVPRSVMTEQLVRSLRVHLPSTANNALMKVLVDDSLHDDVAALANLERHRQGILPSDEEITAIAQSSAAISSELLRAYAELERIKKTYCSQLEMNASFISSVRRLPVEVLQDIFLFCHALQQELIGTAYIPALPTDLRDPNYSQVCLSWRRAALGLPEVWDHVRLCCQALSDDHDRISRRICLYLERAKTAPLHIYIDRGSRTYNPEETMWERLCAESRRWKTLSLIADVSYLVELPQSEFDALESVSLTIGDVSGSEKAPSTAFLDLAPNVRSAKVHLANGVLPDHRDLRVPEAWALESLDIRGEIVLNMQPAMRQSAATLTSLTLAMNASLVLSAIEEGQLTLPALIYIQTEYAASDIFHFLVAPALYSIDVVVPMPSFATAFASMAERSGLQASLGKLYLNAATMQSEEDYQTLFSSFLGLHALTDVAIRNDVHRYPGSLLDHRLMEALTCSDDKPSRLPHLHSLTLFHSRRPYEGPTTHAEAGEECIMHHFREEEMQDKFRASALAFVRSRTRRRQGGEGQVARLTSFRADINFLSRRDARELDRRLEDFRCFSANDFNDQGAIRW